jgi:hypothetical protein
MTGSRDARTPQRSRAHVPRRRGAGAILATAGVTLLVAACGGSGRSPGAGATTGPASGVAYSACMRSHGVARFPDPTENGQVAKADPQELGVSTSRYQAAQRACRRLIPLTGATREQQQETQCAMAGECSQAVVQEWMSGLHTLAGCLRSHGVPSWPDPVLTPQGLPHYPYDQAGIDHHSAPILAKVGVCVRLTGFQGLPLP